MELNVIIVTAPFPFPLFACYIYSLPLVLTKTPILQQVGGLLSLCGVPWGSSRVQLTYALYTAGSGP